MLNQNVMYTPDEVAQMLKLNTHTVYELIKNGELVAKKIGRVYRIPAAALSYVFTGLDADLYRAEQVDKTKLTDVQKSLTDVRRSL